MENSVPLDRFYVYFFYRGDSEVPFYIGKGCGGRIDGHEMCARNRATCKHLTCRIIRKEWHEGREIRKVKIAEGIPEKDAFQLEQFFISIGATYNWPLVNKTFGGEGVSGYQHTPGQRAERKRIAQHLRDTGKFEHLKTINIGRKHTPEVVRKRRQRVTEAWSNPELIEQQRQKQQERWSNPEEIAKQKERFADPAMRAKCGEANKGKESPITKDYEGFVSPDGVVHAPIHNLAAFCRQHGLQRSGMCLVAQGKQSQHLGWTRYPPIEKHPYKGAGFVSPVGEIYADIPHLSKFCEQHGISQQRMSQVSTGKIKSHKGWTRYDSEATQPSLFES